MFVLFLGHGSEIKGTSGAHQEPEVEGLVMCTDEYGRLKELPPHGSKREVLLISLIPYLEGL